MTFEDALREYLMKTWPGPSDPVDYYARRYPSELRMHRALWDARQPEIDTLATQVAELTAENERLRAAAGLGDQPFHRGAPLGDHAPAKPPWTEDL